MNESDDGLGNWNALGRAAYVCISNDHLMCRGQGFLLSYLHEKYRTAYLGSREVRGHLAVTLEEGASPHQILAATLQAAIFRRLAAMPEHIPLTGPKEAYQAPLVSKSGNTPSPVTSAKVRK